MIRFEQLLNKMYLMKDVFVPMTDEQFHKVQQAGFSMLKDIQEVCRDNNITVMLGFGSCLGAVRHHGFVPWDDDIDLFMPRKDYERFLSICEACLPGNMKVYSPYTTLGPEVRYTKIIDDAVIIPEGGGVNKASVCVDVFPLENYDECWLRRKWKWAVYLLLSTAATTSRLWADRKKDTDYKFTMKLSKRGTVEYAIRLAIGFCFSFLSFQRWLIIADKWLICNKETGHVFIPSIFINTNPMDRDMVLPPSKGDFDGYEVFLPNNPERYLEFQYGDWQKLPPEEKRRQHLFFRKKNSNSTKA